MQSLFRVYLSVLTTAALLTGCNTLPTSGPTAKQIDQAAGNAQAAAAIQVVDVDDAVTRQLLSERTQRLFSETLGGAPPVYGGIGPGDGIEISIWEAPPATLFGGSASDSARATSNAARATTLPEQIVDRDGFVTVPFIGKVMASGKTVAAIETDIAKRLTGKANHPEVVIRQTRNLSSTVTVVGEVAASVKLPLTPAGERLLDALAAAGGTRQPVNKMTIQVSRGADYFALPLETVIRDPRQNIPLRAGDVVTAIFQSLSFTALGATGKNEEINFEAQGITLAQALARAGGLRDERSDAQGVFIFRLERKEALAWPRQPAVSTPEGLVPVVYRIDLRNPGSFFVMQSFAINNKDVLYVSNAPAAEFQKFLNLVFSVAYPILTGVQVTK